jgi:hypothetical protein
MGADKNVRRVLFASSEKVASFRQRPITVSARVVISVIRTGYRFEEREPSLKIPVSPLPPPSPE